MFRNIHMQVSNGSSLEWFAIRVKSNRERITARGLCGKGYEVFLPQYRVLRSRAKQVDERPLFPGYLFCRFDPGNRLPILTLPGVVHIVGFGKTLVPVDDSELESLRVLIEAGLPINPNESYTVGQKVRIEQGPLASASGVVMGLQDQRLVVSITLLQRSVSVVMEREWLSSVTPEGETHTGPARNAAA
jgi:transcriptional antiterminator NusG